MSIPSRYLVSCRACVQISISKKMFRASKAKMKSPKKADPDHSSGNDLENIPEQAIGNI